MTDIITLASVLPACAPVKSTKPHYRYPYVVDVVLSPGREVAHRLVADSGPPTYAGDVQTSQRRGSTRRVGGTSTCQPSAWVEHDRSTGRSRHGNKGRGRAHVRAVYACVCAYIVPVRGGSRACSRTQVPAYTATFTFMNVRFV